MQNSPPVQFKDRYGRDIQYIYICKTCNILVGRNNLTRHVKDNHDTTIPLSSRNNNISVKVMSHFIRYNTSGLK